MGSMLSFITLQTVIPFVVTIVCALTWKVVLNSAGNPYTALASDDSLPLSSCTSSKSMDTKPKKKRRGNKSQRKVGKTEPKPPGPEGPSDSGPGLGRAVVNVASKSDPHAVPFPQPIPGSFETGDNADTHGSDAVDDSQGTCTMTTIKKGKRMNASPVLLDPGALVENRTGLEVTSGQRGPVESGVPSSSACSKSMPLATEPRLESPNRRALERIEPCLHSSPSFDTDSSWTRIESHHLRHPEYSGSNGEDVPPIFDDLASSDFGATTTGDSVIIEDAEYDAGNTTEGNDMGNYRRTKAEDMLTQSDVPTRVVRIVPRTGDMPATSAAWGNYEDVGAGNTTANDADGEDEGGWGVVKGKSRSNNIRATPQKAPTMTKKQRQNAKKRQAIKAVKAEAEKARIESLARHRRNLAHQQVIELSRPSGGKCPSGGMQALVDDRGKLVWE